MTFVVAVGTTETVLIDGISAAGANPDVMSHTSPADVEVLEYCRPVYAPFAQVSPSGCPTPSLMRRAVADLVDPGLRVIDAGVAMQEVRKRVIEYYDGLVGADGPG